jgi:hypothetical protein
VVDEAFIRGRKSIIEFFLKKFNFGETKNTWQTVRSWKRRFGFPIRYLPNNQPYIIPSEVTKWAITYDENRKENI